MPSHENSRGGGFPRAGRDSYRRDGHVSEPVSPTRRTAEESLFHHDLAILRPVLDAPILRTTHFVFTFGAGGELKGHGAVRSHLPLQLEDRNIDSVRPV